MKLLRICSCEMCRSLMWIPAFFFFFNDTATTEIYTLSLHDALPIALGGLERRCPGAARLGGVVLGRHERGRAAVPGRRSLRRRSTRRHRALGRGSPAAAGTARSVPGAGERVAAPRPRGFRPRRAVLAACGWTSGNGGRWRGWPG